MRVPSNYRVNYIPKWLVKDNVRPKAINQINNNHNVSLLAKMPKRSSRKFPAISEYVCCGGVKIGFYRAMHFSAKRGIAIACRLSVCLSVTLVNCDHIG